MHDIHSALNRLLSFRESFLLLLLLASIRVPTKFSLARFDQHSSMHSFSIALTHFLLLVYCLFLFFYGRLEIRYIRDLVKIDENCTLHGPLHSGVLSLDISRKQQR